MSGNKNSFFGAIFGEDENQIIAYTYTGAMYFFKKENKNEPYKSLPIVHGHFKSVTDICWDLTEGKYLLSTSADQTTRIYGKNKFLNTWHEFGRPQIHGYDINSIAFLNNIDDRSKGVSLVNNIISASEEKIIRMFEPSYSLVKILNEQSGLNVRMSLDKPNEEYEKAALEGNKQALGLMTKQVVIEDDDEMKFDITNFDPTAMLTNQKVTPISSNENYKHPPDEDFLTNHTLWPELNKLYGHSYEVFVIAASHKGDVFASAGSAKTEKYAQLFIWSVGNNNVIQKLEGHTLTIVQIQFSKDDNLILTVSRGK